MKYWKIGRSWVGDGAECSRNSGTEWNGKIKRIKGKIAISSHELMFNEGTSYGVGTVRVVAIGHTEILDSSRPSIRKVVVHVGVLRGQNE